MIDAGDISVTKIQRSKLNDVELENVPFGRYFTDHMLEADYNDGEWTSVKIKPYQSLLRLRILWNYDTLEIELISR